MHPEVNDRQEVKLGSQKPPKDGNESQTHGLSNALLHSSVSKVEIVLILSQKVIQSRIRPWTRSDLGIGCISMRSSCRIHGDELALLSLVLFPLVQKITINKLPE